MEASIAFNGYQDLVTLHQVSCCMTLHAASSPDTAIYQVMSAGTAKISLLAFELLAKSVASLKVSIVFNG